jgi:magnesium chelatase family protein
VPAVAPEDLARAQSGETTASIRSRVARARERQMDRQRRPNARLEAREVDAHCAPDPAGAALLAQAVRRLGLSARGHHRVLKVARTIADLAGEAHVRANHLAEAIQYRRYERG